MNIVENIVAKGDIARFKLFLIFIIGPLKVLQNAPIVSGRV